MYVEEYRQKIEWYILRVGIDEEEDLTIARFLSGLNYNIRDRVELLPYQNLNELVQMCIKVEQQLLRKPIRKDSSLSFSKSDFQKKDFSHVKETAHRHPAKGQDKGETSKRGSEIKCFKCLGRGHVASQCPTKRTIVLKGQDLYNSQGESSEESSSSSDSHNDKSSKDKLHSYPQEGSLLMNRRLLNNQPTLPLIDQRENIFHIRCDVLNNTCSLIIDSASCCNCCRTRMVEKLNLTLLPHPKPDKLHWLNEDGDLKVKHQVLVKFSTGRYKDKVLCDVIPMEACHILLGRPWQFDRKTTHHGHTNEITLQHHSKTFVLHPLTPAQVASDKAQIRARREEESSTNSTKLSKASKKKVEEVSPSKDVHHEVLLSHKTLLQTLHVEHPSYLLLCHAVLTCLQHPSLKDLPPSVCALLHEFANLFPKDGPPSLPHFRGIERKIDFIPGASLPNRSAHRTNPIETKEIETQVIELLDKGWVQKSLSPYVVPVLLVPKKDGKWRMC